MHEAEVHEVSVALVLKFDWGGGSLDYRADSGKTRTSPLLDRKGSNGRFGERRVAWPFFGVTARNHYGTFEHYWIIAA